MSYCSQIIQLLSLKKPEILYMFKKHFICLISLTKIVSTKG